MKQILVELDDRSLRELERVAPAKRRMRAEFIRRAIRQALDAALERETEAAYRAKPFSSAWDSGDLEGWDPVNALAQRVTKGQSRTPTRRKRK